MNDIPRCAVYYSRIFSPQLLRGPTVDSPKALAIALARNPHISAQ
jgi:hypothetical protein